MDWENLIRKETRALKPWEDPALELLSERKTTEIVRLSTSENYFIEKQWLDTIFEDAMKEVDIRSYPVERSLNARRAMAEFFDVKASEVVIGNGSDELIELLPRVFINPGDEIIAIDPTFSVYKIAVELAGGRYIPVPLGNDFNLDCKKILEKITDKTKFIVICSPNNPTGNQFSEEQIREVLTQTDKIVIVDEAYVEFADFSVLPLIREFDNLIVFSTFSKSAGVAGLRLGFLFTNVTLASYFLRVIGPFSVNLIAQQMTIKLLQNFDYVRKKADEIKQEREYLGKELSKFPVKVFPSKANFLLIKIQRDNLSATKVVNELMKKGVLVRDLSSHPLLENCFRTAIGTREMNAKLINSLKDII
jgi:histidinol-phosphate aminotransferase